MIHLYRCKECGKYTRVEAPIGVSPKLLVKCECGGEYVRKFFAPSVHFHGSGFYATDKVLSEPTEDDLYA
ncbi:MAG TPA: hypothetical protein PKD55_02460 [Bellilinea sp.]|nr:hypothetical protein [Bellilinea sp.]